MKVAALQKQLMLRISKITDFQKLEYLEEELNAKESFDEDCF
jgi:hypothetical protein